MTRRTEGGAGARSAATPGDGADTAKGGSGLRTAADPDTPVPEPGVVDWSAALAGRTRAGVGGGIAEIMAFASGGDIMSLAGGFPDPATFPVDSLPDAVREILAEGDSAGLQYTPTAGLASTREYLASRLERLQGRRPAPDELLVTSGAIEALELVAKSFVDPGDVVVVEGPTYLGGIMAFRGFEGRVVAVGMDEEGLRTDELGDALLAGLRPKLLYTIPDHQNPAGVSLTAERRDHLLALARRYGFLVVEDVAYRELSFDGRAAPSLWSLDPEVVVQAGTFSKLFFPGVRLGWAVGPAPVAAQLVLGKQNTDQCAGGLGQRLLEHYGRSGRLDEQIARSRAFYGRRCELLLAAMEAEMPQEASWTRPRGGFFTWLTIAGEVDAAALARETARRGVAVAPGTLFFPDGRGDRSLRLAFSRIDDREIPEAARRIGAVVREALGRPGRRQAEVLS